MQKGKNTAIIVAAGSGTRLASDIPKQFLSLNGREILSYSVQSFLDHPMVNDVIIVTSEPFLDQVISNYPLCHVVTGGATRQISVSNGINACSPDTKIILVHDAARPLIPQNVITDCLNALNKLDGVAPAIKPVDSMVQIQGESFQNLNRNDLRIVQTPQCFHLNILRQAHNSDKIDTDEMGLVKQAIPTARLGFVVGASETMKITQTKDLEISQIYLRSRQP